MKCWSIYRISSSFNTSYFFSLDVALSLRTLKNIFLLEKNLVNTKYDLSSEYFQGNYQTNDTLDNQFNDSIAATYWNPILWIILLWK